MVTKHNRVHPLKARFHSLHYSLRCVLLLAQFMGQMPVSGITSTNPGDLKFEWKSWRFVYCMMNCVGNALVALACFNQIFICGLDVFKVSTVMFNVSTLVMTLLFLKLATEWPGLMRSWGRVEYMMRNYGWPMNLQVRIVLITGVMLSIGFIEYSLDKLSWFLLQRISSNNVHSTLYYYFTGKLNPQVFTVVNYALWKGILVQAVNIFTTFAWSFTDIFIMLMSTALAVRFKQITTRLVSIKNNSKSSGANVWREIREDYNRLAMLTRDLDSAISYIVLLSFANNLFFILIQLFNSLRPMKNTIEKVYFFVSFGFLIVRTVCVSICGAWVYDESKRPGIVINELPTDAYSLEVHRFADQIRFSTVALSGKQYFYIKKGLVLSMAGAVVTYELVLIQFNQNLLKESAVQNTNNFTVLIC